MVQEAAHRISSSCVSCIPRRSQTFCAHGNKLLVLCALHRAPSPQLEAFSFSFGFRPCSVCLSEMMKLYEAHDVGWISSKASETLYSGEPRHLYPGSAWGLGVILQPSSKLSNLCKPPSTRQKVSLKMAKDPPNAPRSYPQMCSSSCVWLRERAP